jgi:acyl carrier protein
MEKLKEIINQIRDNKDLDPINNLDSNLDLRNDLGLDSLDLAELTVRLENDFGIDVFEDGIVLKVGEIIAKLKKANE